MGKDVRCVKSRGIDGRTEDRSGDVSGVHWNRLDYFNRRRVMGMITVGIDCSSVLFLSLKACTLLASKAV